jgi:hypothetical protein
MCAKCVPSPPPNVLRLLRARDGRGGLDVGAVLALAELDALLDAAPADETAREEEVGVVVRASDGWGGEGSHARALGLSPRVRASLSLCRSRLLRSFVGAGGSRKKATSEVQTLDYMFSSPSQRSDRDNS